VRRIQSLVILLSNSRSWARVIASGVIASGALATGILVSGLSGCGGQTEAPPQAPSSTPVAWKHADGDSKSEAPTADREAQSSSNEIDLDALEASEASAKSAAAGKKAEPKAEPKPKPEPKPEVKAEAAAAAEDLPSEGAEAPVEEPPAAPATVAAVPLGKEMRAAVKDTEKEPTPKKPPPKKKPAAAAAVPAYTGPNPCTTAHFKVPRVEQACANGGRTAAKSVMKEAIGKALAAGASLKCATCHAEQNNFTLKKDAVAELKKWLGP
jgi:hypothetical protein